MPECIGVVPLLAMAGMTVVASALTVALTVLSYRRDRRQRRGQAAFLRAQIRNHLEVIQPLLKLRDRPLAEEGRHSIDEFRILMHEAHVLDAEEWDALLATQPLLLLARNNASFNKRHVKLLERAVDRVRTVIRDDATTAPTGIAALVTGVSKLRSRTRSLPTPLS